MSQRSFILSAIFSHRLIFKFTFFCFHQVVVFFFHFFIALKFNWQQSDEHFTIKMRKKNLDLFCLFIFRRLQSSIQKNSKKCSQSSILKRSSFNAHHTIHMNHVNIFFFFLLKLVFFLQTFFVQLDKYEKQKTKAAELKPNRILISLKIRCCCGF